MQPSKQPTDIPNQTSQSTSSDPLFMPSADSVGTRLDDQEHYERLLGKDPRRLIIIRSPMRPDSGIEIDPGCKFERVIADLMDAPELQRLRHVQQLSGSWAAFPGARHSRFEHTIGSAKLTCEALASIKRNAPSELNKHIDDWGTIAVAFAMLHDIGHIAPGSHLAQKVWFPDSPDKHEEVSHALLQQCPGLIERLEGCLGHAGYQKLLDVVQEGKSATPVPGWTWQLIVGGGWNTDRGDWVKRDSKACGVRYGDYDQAIIMKNLTITPQGDLAIKPAAISALASFFMARAQMHVNVYGDETSRIGERLHELIGFRARQLYSQDMLCFADSTVRAILSASEITDVPAETLLEMTDSIWEYHVVQWSKSPSDPVLQTMCRQLLERDLPKSINDEALIEHAKNKLQSLELPEQYYITAYENKGPDLQKDLTEALKVLESDGSVKPLEQCNKLFEAFTGIDNLERPAFTAFHPSLIRDVPIN